jgi:hypothetical protein
LLVKFKKSNFPYVISTTDNIKLEGDVVSTWARRNQIS